MKKQRNYGSLCFWHGTLKIQPHIHLTQWASYWGPYPLGQGVRIFGFRVPELPDLLFHKTWSPKAGYDVYSSPIEVMEDEAGGTGRGQAFPKRYSE